VVHTDAIATDNGSVLHSLFSANLVPRVSGFEFVPALWTGTRIAEPRNDAVKMVNVPTGQSRENDTQDERIATDATHSGVVCFLLLVPRKDSSVR